MPVRIDNASEAGHTQRALTTARHILHLLEQVEAEAEALAALHWYGDLPDTRDSRDNLSEDISEHQAALGRWQGNITIQAAAALAPADTVDDQALNPLRQFVARQAGKPVDRSKNPSGNSQ